MIPKRRVACRIDLTSEALGVSAEAVRRAAKIHNVPLFGNLLGCPPARLQLDFLRTIREENAALVAQESRRTAQ